MVIMALVINVKFLSLKLFDWARGIEFPFSTRRFSITTLKTFYELGH